MNKIVILILVQCLFFVQAGGQNPDAVRLKSGMIWDAGTVLPDTVPYHESFPVSVGFRKEFLLSNQALTAVLHVFADSRYILWINGVYVARGPNRFDPKRPEYDTHQVAGWLRKGKNTIAVLVQGGLSNYRFMYHQPGLGVVLEAMGPDGKVLASLNTDESWRCSSATRFGKPVVMLSGITDRIDEKLEQGDWLNPDFDDSGWSGAVAANRTSWGDFYPRMIPLLRETPVAGARILKITRDGRSVEMDAPLNVSMPLELKAPATILIDMGQMVRAWFEVDFKTDDESHLEIIPRQSYTNRTAGFLGSCHYTAGSRPGPRKYMTTDDYTCRLIYITLHSGSIKLNDFKVVERRYPFERTGSFRCNDDFLNQLWDMSMRTSEVNAVDGYIDGSEGGEWVTGLTDYPVTEVAFQAPDEAGKAVYSDLRLIGNQISRMALSQEGDGLIKGWHPSDWHKGPRDQGRGIHNYIEDSSPSWINLLRIYYDGTGDAALVERQWPVLETLIKWFLDRRTARGLVLAREFYLHFDNPVAFHVCEGATLNAFVYGALVDAAWLAKKTGRMERAAEYAEAARQLAEAYNRYLWDENSGTYYAGLEAGEKKLITPWPHEPWKKYYAAIDQEKEFLPATVQAAVMALSRGLVPENRLNSVRKYLLGHHHEFVSPVSYLYAFEAFYQMNTKEADQEAIEVMRKRWALMVGRKMPGTLGEQFDDQSYYCHDFGPVPSAFLSSYVLGVRRDGPLENKRIIIEPRLGDLTQASGVVITRHGPVPVEWNRMEHGGLGFRLVIPPGVTASVSFPKLSENPRLTINGKVERQAKVSSRFLTIKLGPGEYSGNITP
jgi:alpha-L-rhamnosidase